uniref:Uncharacterized protein n=1 Tax=Anguilla anguilla TaxID=7936 RepID=A0A0E9SZP1_ANGAN
MTACRRFPLPRVASACFSRSYWWEPSGMFFFGLKVFEERFPKRKLMAADKLTFCSVLTRRKDSTENLTELRSLVCV